MTLRHKAYEKECRKYRTNVTVIRWLFVLGKSEFIQNDKRVLNASALRQRDVY
jgi:hypothetical protein